MAIPTQGQRPPTQTLVLQHSHLGAWVPQLTAACELLPNPGPHARLFRSLSVSVSLCLCLSLSLSLSQ